jgi:hypothetical protein
MKALTTNQSEQILLQLLAKRDNHFIAEDCLANKSKMKQVNVLG